jgi:uncharacterized membrane protein
MKKIINFLPFILVIICVLYLGVLILSYIGLLAFWLDEAAVALVVNNGPSLLFQKAIMDIHPLLYIILIKIWTQVFGLGEISLRGFSAIFGILIVILLYLFGRNILRSKKLGLCAGFLGATNYMIFWYSTQARPYTMAAFFGLLSVYFFSKNLESNNRKIRLSYIIFTSFMFYVHIWMVLIFISELIMLIFLSIIKKHSLKKFIIPILFISISGIPAIYIYLLQNKMFGNNLWIQSLSLNTIKDSISYISYGNTGIYLLLLLIPIISEILKIYRNLENSENRLIKLDFSKYINKFDGNKLEWSLIISVYLLFPFLFLILISLIRPLYVPGRYEMIFLPAIILSLAYFLSRIKNYLIFAIIVILVTVLNTKTVIDQKNTVKGYKSTDKTIMSEIMSLAKKGDIIVATDLSFATMKYYSIYFDKTNNKGLTYVSYPIETETHPGFKKRYDLSIDKNTLVKEANDLVLLSEKNNAKVIVLYNTGNPIDEILLNQFRDRNFQIKMEHPLQPREPSWFDQILIITKA